MAARRVLIGTPWVEGRQALQRRVCCSTAGKVAALTFKIDLPNYGVFDEKRVFRAGPAARAIQHSRRAPRRADLRGHLDARTSSSAWRRPAREILLVPNGSPFEAGKEDVRLKLVAARVAETGLPLVYLNQVGGQDELVFDGASFVVNADRTLRGALPSWEEAVVITDWRAT